MDIATYDTTFIMQGAHAVVSDGMLHIEEQVKALEQAVTHNTGLAFDLSRTLVESVCRTIITERENTYDNDDNLPKLLKKTTQIIPLLPESMASDKKARKSLEQTINGLSTAIQGVCELRGDFGFASHGRDKSRPKLEEVQALFVAQAVDAIIGLLYRVHKQDLSKSKVASLKHDSNLAFNEWLNEQCDEVCILSLPPYMPSDVLYNVDVEAYRELLANYTAEDEFTDPPREDQEEGEMDQ